MYDFLSKSKILVIDDFAGFRQTLKTMLQRLGAQHIDQSSNGSEAIKRCKDENYNIIFCDYNLGVGQDGQQILEELHQRSLLKRGTLFLMVTAETTTAQVMAAIEYKPDAYLTKPFTNDQLGQRLKRLIIKNAALNKIYSAINVGKIEMAIKLCDEVITDSPKFKFSCLRIKSELLEQQRHLQQAMSLYTEVIKEQPLLWAMLGIGRITFLNGDVEGALQHFQTMRENFSNQVSVLDWIARCQKVLGKSENAEETLREAVSISPKSVSRQANLGEVAASLNNHELAQKAFARTIQEGSYSCMLKPQHFEQYYDNTREVVQSLSPREKSRMLAETEVVHKKMERAYSNDPSVMAINLSSEAALYSAVGQKDKTSTILSRLSKVLDDPGCQINHQQLESIGKHLQNFEDDKSSEKYLVKVLSSLNDIQEDLDARQVVADEPEDITLLAKRINSQGMQMAKQGRSMESLKKFREAISLNPQNINYLLNASQIIIENNDLKSDPEIVQEAKHYLLDSIHLDEKDVRWKRYQKLLSRVSND